MVVIMTYKSKHLYCMTKEGGQIHALLQYNIKTNHITISNNFNKYKPRPINKESPVYLGIIIAEQVLSKVFKDIKIMPYGHKGYDFICSNNFLIDAKSSCKSKTRGNWLFHINKNKTANYFALLAFNNRTDITPLHFWLIPGDVINDKINMSISESTINKWDKYRQDITKIIKCCDNLKGEN